MSYHIVSIDSPQCRLSCRDGQLTCRTPGAEERTLPLEDVASIIITSFSAEIHSHLLLEAARHGVSLILCESHKPASLVLPANRSTDTLLTRASRRALARFRGSVVGFEAAEAFQVVRELWAEDHRTAIRKPAHRRRSRR